MSSEKESFLSTTTTHLRHQETRGVGGPEHVDEEVIGQHIQLLDFLSLAHSAIVNITMLVSTLTRSHLHIGVSGCPEEVGDARPPHRGGHRLARGLDAGQQLRQVSCNVNTITYFYFHFIFYRYRK